MEQKIPLLIIGILFLLNPIIAQETDIGMQQIQQCEPNSYACSFDDSNNEVIKQCNPEGSLYEIVETCSPSEKCHLTIEGAECEYKYKENSSTNYFAWVLVIALLIILIIVLIRKKRK